MACFLVPTAEAIVTTIAQKVLASKEKNMEIHHESGSDKVVEKSHFSRKLGWLNNMLWGGSALLALEHVWHGEVVPWFPFLTAATDSDSTTFSLYSAQNGISLQKLKEFENISLRNGSRPRQISSLGSFPFRFFYVSPRIMNSELFFN